MTPMVSPTGHRIRAVAVVAIAGFAYLGLQYILLNALDNILLRFVVATPIYFLAIYLYYAVMRATAIGAGVMLAALGLIIAVIGTGLAQEGDAFAALFDTVRVFGVGLLVGYLVSRRRGLTTAYIAGTVAMIAIGCLQYWTIWPAQMEAVSMLGDKLTDLINTNPFFSASSAEVKEELSDSLRSDVALMVRVTPASVLMSGITQMSLGYLLFLYRGVKDGRLTMPSIRFMQWKMPYQFSAVLIAAIGLRLLGNETMQLIADNLIAILAIYYCVVGLALIDWFLKLLNLKFWFRALFYIFLTITGVLGFTLVAVIGFIDSFRDFRRKTMIDLSLKKE